MEKVITLFRKIISSLACINKKSTDNQIKKKSEEYLSCFINKYENFMITKKLEDIMLYVDIKDIIDFCNECYEIVEIFDYAEDVEYGLKELVEVINNERKN